MTVKTWNRNSGVFLKVISPSISQPLGKSFSSEVSILAWTKWFVFVFLIRGKTLLIPQEVLCNTDPKYKCHWTASAHTEAAQHGSKHCPQTVSISCSGSWHSALNGVTEQVLFTNTVVQEFTALLNHLIPEQKTFSDHKPKPLWQQRLKSVNSHTGTEVFAPQFIDTAKKLSLIENSMSHKLVLTEMPNLTLSRKIQRNCMKAKMLQKKSPKTCESTKKSKNKR